MKALDWKMGISAMEKQKLRLKERISGPNTSMDRLRSHYAQPKPPSALERFGATAKRLGLLIVYAVVAVSVFLAIPFRSWDDYAVWQHVQDALLQLETHPDSFQELQRVSAAAKPAHILWDQPSGVRPEKWYQHFQQSHYDESYGVVQVLAVGLVKHGNTSRGLSELERLRERTAHCALPDFPPTDQISKKCTQCKNGKFSLETLCPACGGSGKCKRCDGQGSVLPPSQNSSFLLKAKLGGTHQKERNIGKESLIHLNCPDCKKTGKCPACAGAGKSTATSICPACGGKVTIINSASVSPLFLDSVKSATAAIERSMTVRRAIHTCAAAQRALLQKSGALGARVFPTEQVDPVSNSTDPDASLPSPAKPNEGVTSKGEGPQSAETEKSKDAPQNPVEARLQEACETLQRTPLSAPDLQVLAEVSRFETNNPALRSRAMAAFGLSLLLQGNTNAFTRVAQIQKTAFPDLPPLFTLTEEDYTATCETCLGKGKAEMPCPSCTGPNTCKVCKGAGKTAAGEGFVPCEVCRRKGTCRMCNGQKQKPTMCPTCRGFGKIVKPNDRVRKNYNDLLTNIVAMCQENVAAHSDKVKPAQTEMIGGTHVTPCEDVSRAPGASAQNDSASLQKQPTAKQAETPATQKLPMGVITLIGGLLLILTVRHFSKKKPAHGSNALPGMDKLNTEDFTDPLTLTALESRSHHSDNSTEPASAQQHTDKTTPPLP